VGSKAVSSPGNFNLKLFKCFLREKVQFAYQKISHIFICHSINNLQKFKKENCPIMGYFVPFMEYLLFVRLLLCDKTCMVSFALWNLDSC
jgi:hypothetical protein